MCMWGFFGVFCVFVFVFICLDNILEISLFVTVWPLHKNRKLSLQRTAFHFYSIVQIMHS